ncbi:hypothetical protein E2C01_065364 [Portunus trituberculatus]|uniref:Uncharacterized protein n=1 Tax=Portunus trituberculatus TaxID=210409 RepID=A0A5B7HN65_PORTR|nr:hypothetical protein [Portunus trituberculatus]
MRRHMTSAAAAPNTKSSSSLLSLTVDHHGECLSWREVFYSLASRYDYCKALSHDQILCPLESIKDLVP